jgi:type IV secretory pathway VirB4 component
MQKSRPAQDFIPFKEVRDGVIIMKDDSIRTVLMASSLNIALKSQEEQEAIIMQFQNFLNSLEFSTQFYIQSRRLDIRPYLALLEEKEKEQVNELMKIQTKEYIDFIRNFTETTNIMSKNFFIVVPYTSNIGVGVGKRWSALSIFGGGDVTTQKKNTKEWLENFEESKTQLEQRIAIVESGLSRFGIRVALLGTEEIIELFYKIFNPGEIDKPIPFEGGK